jgi:hypothetical protein
MNTSPITNQVPRVDLSGSDSTRQTFTSSPRYRGSASKYLKPLSTTPTRSHPSNPRHNENHDRTSGRRCNRAYHRPSLCRRSKARSVLPNRVRLFRRSRSPTFATRSATSGLMHHNKRRAPLRAYSIATSARSSSTGGRSEVIRGDARNSG